MFTEKDHQQLREKGITVAQVLEQIDIFKEGVPFVNLLRSATVKNGIVSVSEEVKQRYISLYDSEKDGVEVMKFIPASGAATRMFRSLFKFLDKFNPERETFNTYVNREKAHDMQIFFVGVEKLPFYDEVIQSLKHKEPGFDSFPDDRQKYLFVREMLAEDGLNYGAFPKGLLPFHKYKTHSATAFEEHLYEAALYDVSNGVAQLHFTISEKHSHKFDAEFNKIENYVGEKTSTSFTISFSYQKKSTDTIAVTPEDKPFRTNDGSLLFRPAGHGALIENLNDQDADIIFVKNIDNVVVYRYKHEMAGYKKMLGGILMEYRDKIFAYAKMLDEEEITEEQIAEIKTFLHDELNTLTAPDFYKYTRKYQIEHLKEKLNRPIRVCGMVKNEGDPGGGPFWVKDEDGNISLQVIEAAQVDHNNKKQVKILKGATHFNPVDIVCGVKNYKGEKYNLLDFVDPKQAFITEKTREGKELKALERPGLWNGGMAFWNTIFVEVPLATFNPVKTVNDLLKPAHQVKKMG
ncbi:DUF4301 family protein [Sinomicrobium weinanense]|uniref:DUF4301 family protein n=1 Tax=Sinomicrobium weinanense TaxID=2842200 RepID=A0A926JQ53_9FLAO|nr:DUF4301 family protein [Sinomicrobium weinanense]MBC9795403.1 DUF4301 family protein [Sinomicrobium weinanense]MBU3123928.1 DUF4301 family protein [Sinomicrobium weinanense]